MSLDLGDYVPATHVGGNDVQGHGQHREKRDSGEGDRYGELALFDNDVAGEV